MLRRCAPQNDCFNADEDLLRIYHDQPIAHPLHWRDERSSPTRLRASTQTRARVYQQVQHHSIGLLEETSDIRSAIAREKQIKGWLRAKKVALIESTNPTWKDLSREWLD